MIQNTNHATTMAQQLAMCIEIGAMDATVEHSARQLVSSLGGNPHIPAKTPGVMSLYIISLLLANRT